MLLGVILNVNCKVEKNMEDNTYKGNDAWKRIISIIIEGFGDNETEVDGQSLIQHLVKETDFKERILSCDVYSITNGLKGLGDYMSKRSDGILLKILDSKIFDYLFEQWDCPIIDDPIIYALYPFARSKNADVHAEFYKSLMFRRFIIEKLHFETYSFFLKVSLPLLGHLFFSSHIIRALMISNGILEYISELITFLKSNNYTLIDAVNNDIFNFLIAMVQDNIKLEENAYEQGSKLLMYDENHELYDSYFNGDFIPRIIEIAQKIIHISPIRNELLAVLITNIIPKANNDKHTELLVSTFNFGRIIETMKSNLSNAETFNSFFTFIIVMTSMPGIQDYDEILNNLISDAHKLMEDIFKNYSSDNIETALTAFYNLYNIAIIDEDEAESMLYVLFSFIGNDKCTYKVRTMLIPLIITCAIETDLSCVDESFVEMIIDSIPEDDIESANITITQIDLLIEEFDKKGANDLIGLFVSGNLSTTLPELLSNIREEFEDDELNKEIDKVLSYFPDVDDE